MSRIARAYGGGMVSAVVLTLIGAASGCIFYWKKNPSIENRQS